MMFWQRPDLIKKLLPNVDLVTVQNLRDEADKQLEIQKFRAMAEAVKAVPDVNELMNRPSVELNSDAVKIGSRADLADEQHERILAAIELLHPWRKGPFELFGEKIDSEWRSNLKWDRIAPALGELKNRRVLDLGCGNGYYMFRAAAMQPGLVLGLDPSLPFYLTFELMQRYLRLENLQYERMGHEQLDLFDSEFDIALCMGVLYHHRSPIEILKKLRESIRIGGIAIVESQTISGDGSWALFPEGRYAKARNVFFMPTHDCLMNWIRKAGFKNVELVSHTKVTPEEQRATKNMTFESLADFLDPEDETKTLEGYPAPWRTVVRAERQH